MAPLALDTTRPVWFRGRHNGWSVFSNIRGISGLIHVQFLSKKIQLYPKQSARKAFLTRRIAKRPVWLPLRERSPLHVALTGSGFCNPLLDGGRRVYF
jgi:hypothetical protein